jgi:hypothetical protein
MQTSGHGNDSLMILVPAGVAVVVGVILFGGPAEAVEAINNIVRDVANEAMTLVSAWL